VSFFSIDLSNILKPYVPLSIKRMSECMCNILKDGEFLIASDSEFHGVLALYTEMPSARAVLHLRRLQLINISVITAVKIRPLGKQTL